MRQTRPRWTPGKGLLAIGALVLTCICGGLAIALLPVLVVLFVLQGIGETRQLLAQGFALFCVLAGATWFLVVYQIHIAQGVRADQEEEGPAPPLAVPERRLFERVTISSFAVIVMLVIVGSLFVFEMSRPRKPKAAAPPYRIESMSLRQLTDSVLVDVATSGMPMGAYEMDVAVANPSPSPMTEHAQLVLVDSARVLLWRAAFRRSQVDSLNAAASQAPDSSSGLIVTATLAKLNAGGRVRSTVVSSVTSRLALR